MLPLTFANPKDYDLVDPTDKVDLVGLEGGAFKPGSQVTMRLHKKDGKTVEVKLNHTFNEGQIEWFKVRANEASDWLHAMD